MWNIYSHNASRFVTFICFIYILFFHVNTDDKVLTIFFRLSTNIYSRSAVETC